MTLADVIIDLGAPGKDAPASFRWLSDWLPDAEQRAIEQGGPLPPRRLCGRRG